MTTRKAVPAYPPAFEDEAWLRGAATIDGAFAAAEALNRQLLAQLGDDGSCGDAPARESARDSRPGGIPPVPPAVAGVPRTARGRAQVAAAGGPRQSATARAASSTTPIARVETGD